MNNGTYSYCQMVQLIQSQLTSKSCVIYDHDNIEFIILDRSELIDFFDEFTDFTIEITDDGIACVDDVYFLTSEVYQDYLNQINKSKFVELDD